MSRAHVLLVDDDPFSLDTLEMILEMDGYRVTCARCKRGALEALESKAGGPRPDLMVVDLEMTDQSAFSLLGEMKTRNLCVPTLVVTEFTSKQTVVDLMRRGVMDYLDKPVVMQEFRQRIALMEKSLRRRGPEGKNPAAEDPEASRTQAGSGGGLRGLAEIPRLRSASAIETNGFGLPSSFRSRFPSRAGGVAALACRREYGCDLITAEAEDDTLEAFYKTVLVKSCFDHHRAEGYDGQSFMTFLNKSLVDGSLSRSAVNAIFARVFLKEGRMEMIVAGRPSMAFLPAGSARPRAFLATSGPLGLSEDLIVEPRILPIDAGDRLFLHTRNFAAAALQDVLTTHRHESLENLVSRTWTDVLAARRERNDHDMFFWGMQIP
jgi:CheY-like chemotaxis protein